MVRQRRASKGMRCLGVLRSAQKCKQARDGSGAVWLNKPCLRCGEQRCKAHCRCGRRGETTGCRTGSSSSSSSAASAAPLAPAPIDNPVGRPSFSTSYILLAGPKWWKAVIADVQAAEEVVLGTYMHDDAKLHEVLMKKLQGRSAFSLTVLVDQEALATNTPKQQRSRSRALHSCNAKVYLCKGDGPKVSGVASWFAKMLGSVACLAQDSSQRWCAKGEGVKACNA